MTPASTSTRRLFMFYVPYLILAIGFGIALRVGFSNSNHLTAERLARLRADCISRVDARAVLRDVIVGAYTPPPGTPPDRAALYAVRRDDLLRRAPALHCVSAAGISVPEPVRTTNAPTTTIGTSP